MKQLTKALTKYLPNAASVAIGLIPILILVLWFDVSRKIIGKGAIAYAVGTVALKLPLYHLIVVKFVHDKFSHKWIAIIQGIVSAFSELGAAMFFYIFVVKELTLTELIGFGIAAGSIEAIILPFMKNPLQGTPLEQHSDETIKKSEENHIVQWMGVWERILASIVHVASRGLVYISYFTGNIIPIIIGFLGFGLVDGRAYFAHLEKWAFDNIKVLGKFYRFLGIVSLSLTTLFLLFYYLLI